MKETSHEKEEERRKGSCTALQATTSKEAPKAKEVGLRPDQKVAPKAKAAPKEKEGEPKGQKGVGLGLEQNLYGDTEKSFREIKGLSFALVWDWGKEGNGKSNFTS